MPVPGNGDDVSSANPALPGSLGHPGGCSRHLLPYSPAGSQTINMRRAARHIDVLLPQLRAEARFADVGLTPYTASGGSLAVSGTVATEHDLADLRALIESSHPPVKASFMVGVRDREDGAGDLPLTTRPGQSKIGQSVSARLLIPNPYPQSLSPSPFQRRHVARHAVQAPPRWTRVSASMGRMVQSGSRRR